MILQDIVNRNPVPQAWGEGDHFPWDDPYFSARMLEMHFDQSHDLASRRFPAIDSHVAFIHGTILGERPSDILELGCGPGFYLSRLARLGHRCAGIDKSPAAIACARDEAEREGLSCVYREEDIYGARFGEDLDLIMLLFGDFNTFNPMDVQEMLGKAWMALKPGGVLLLEPFRFRTLEKLGAAPAHWYSARDGLFSDRTHLCLRENLWNSRNRTATIRWYIVDADSADVRLVAQCYQAYTRPWLRKLFAEKGFIDIAFHPCLTGDRKVRNADFMVMTGRKGPLPERGPRRR